jgi:hypothetical protein
LLLIAWVDAVAEGAGFTINQHHTKDTGRKRIT